MFSVRLADEFRKVGRNMSGWHENPHLTPATAAGRSEERFRLPRCHGAKCQVPGCPLPPVLRRKLFASGVIGQRSRGALHAPHSLQHFCKPAIEFGRANASMVTRVSYVAAAFPGNQDPSRRGEILNMIVILNGER